MCFHVTFTNLAFIILNFWYKLFALHLSARLLIGRISLLTVLSSTMALVLKSLYNYYDYYFNEYVGKFSLTLLVFSVVKFASVCADCRRTVEGPFSRSITLANACHCDRLSLLCQRKWSKLDEGPESFGAELDYQCV